MNTEQMLDELCERVNRYTLTNSVHDKENVKISYEQSLSHVKRLETELQAVKALLRYVFYYRLITGDKVEDYLAEHDKETWEKVRELLKGGEQ